MFSIGAIVSFNASKSALETLYEQRLMGMALLDRVRNWAGYRRKPQSAATRKLADAFDRTWGTLATTLAALSKPDAAVPVPALQQDMAQAIAQAQRTSMAQERDGGHAYRQALDDHAFSVRCALTVLSLSLVTAVAVAVSLLRSQRLAPVMARFRLNPEVEAPGRIAVRPGTAKLLASGA